MPIEFIEAIKKPHIYLDYETNKAGNCYLVGYQIDGKFTQIVTDRRLEGLAEFHNLEIKTPAEATYDLLSYAKDSNSIIVAYSEAEREYFKLFSTNFDSEKFIDTPYLNLLNAARKWIHRYKAEEFDALPPFRLGADEYMAGTLRNSLCSVMRLTSFRAPNDYAPGKTTARFNAVADALVMRSQKYSELTRVQKTKGTKVLKHNRFDVEALPVLFNDILSDSERCFSKSIKYCFDNN